MYEKQTLESPMAMYFAGRLWSYSVERRTKELGIRLAVGVSRQQVIGLLLLELMLLGKIQLWSFFPSYRSWLWLLAPDISPHAVPHE